MRSGVRIGDHLMVDDDTGRVHYASEMVKLWDGRWVHHSKFETRQPQEFVKAGTDPHIVKNVRAEEAVEVPFTGPLIYVGKTTVPAPRGPAYHLYDLASGQ